MKEKIKIIIAHPFGLSSLIMVAGSNFSNFLNYLYHFVTGRLIGPSGYGELVALISLINLVSVLPGSFGTSAVRFLSSAKDKKRKKQLASYFEQKVAILGGVCFGILVLFAPFLASFLHIPTSFILLANLSLFFGFLSTAYRSILQATLKFAPLAASIVTESALKLVISVILVVLGIKLAGAIAGIILASLLAVLLGRFLAKDYLTAYKIAKPPQKAIVKYTIPVLLYSLSITSFFSTDLVLVKHFFSPYLAGIYSSLVNLGKVILFGTVPITNVMFPLVSRAQSEGKNYKKIFFLSILLTFLIASAVSLFYIIFPDLAIHLLYGQGYKEGKQFLPYFAIAYSLFAFSTLLINLHLSLGKTKVVLFPLLAAIFQAVGIVLFHQTITAVITIVSVVSLLLFLSLFFFSVKMVLSD
jgi:O-antigen/teichoic acid export membrane protein